MALCIGAVGSSVFQNHPKIENLVTIDLAEGALKKSTGLRIQADEEFLPFKPACLDLVVSPLVLHSVNDLPGTLLQIRRSLRPDGLFLSAMLGGETLYQLRQVMIDAEMSVRGGISPRIAPFADKPQTGDLMQRAGFSLPVVDSDVVNVTYDNLFKLMHDLRLMGEGNAIANRDKTIPPRSLFMEAARLYQERFSNPAGRITASFEIVFSIGWAPHESQQKPLKRGSATHSLADFLEK
jgi:SAM-dependent methyltransferase